MSSTVRISCLQFVCRVCSHVTLLNKYLSATYLTDLYSHLIGQLQQQHSALCSDEVTSKMQSSARQTHRTLAVSNNDAVMMETTLATMISVFDVDKFNSCLQELLNDVVRYNHYVLIMILNNSNRSNKCSKFSLRLSIYVHCSILLYR